MDSLPEWNLPKWSDPEHNARVDAAMARYLTPAQIQELADLFAICVKEIAERRAAREAREAAAAAVNTEPTLPAPKPKRTRRPSPSRIAKWEAQWQAEQACPDPSATLGMAERVERAEDER